MSAAESILDALAARRCVPQRVMVVAAHPDDETIGLGAQLCRFDDLILVHATDGAPGDGKDAAKYGFGSVTDYAAARRLELDAALAAGEVTARRFHFDIPDQETFRDLAGLTRRLADLLRTERPSAIVTHAYEGGHPDHDAVAFAMHAACASCAEPSAILEMALYHRAHGTRVSGKFLEMPFRRKPEPTHPNAQPLNGGSRLSPGRQFELGAADLARKQRMIDAFATQRWLLEQLDSRVERLRNAPRYDFRRPPHRGTLHYETLGWDVTREEWLGHAAAALTQLGLDRLPCL